MKAQGFSIRRYARWFDIRHSSKRKDFPKLHFIVDLRKLPTLAFKLTPAFKSDGKQVEYLMKFIGSIWRMCADAAYISRKICGLIAKHSCMP